MSKPIQEYFFRKDVKEGFEIIRLSQFFKENPESKISKAHRVRFYAMAFITEGRGRHSIDFKTYEYRERNILFVGKDQVNAWLDYAKVDGFLLLFTEEFLYHNQIIFRDISYAYPYNSSLYQPVIPLEGEERYETFLSLIDYLYKEYRLPESKVKPAILQNLLRTLLLKIQSHAIKEETSARASDKELFIRFQRMIEERISESRNVKDYCHYLQVSYRRLNAACKILTQSTAKEFIDQMAILKAKKHLLDQEKNISEIAYLVGFEEVTNFTKFFKKHVGLTPKAFVLSIQWA